MFGTRSQLTVHRINFRSARWCATFTPKQGLLTKDVIAQLPSTPSISPSYPRGPYRFLNREYFIVTYETDPEALKSFVPDPLVPNENNHVLFEWIAMPDSSGFGNYQESGIVIPCYLDGKPVNFTAAMLLDCEPPIACGREIWGFPKKRANPKFGVSSDTLIGTLEYATQRIATGTMAFKYNEIPKEEAKISLSKQCCNLKVIPDSRSGELPLAQLVGFKLKDIEIIGAWSGPAKLHLQGSSGAPLANLPIKKVIGGKHILANLTLPHGEVLFDYNKANPKNTRAPTNSPPVSLTNENLSIEKVLSTPSMPAYAPSFPAIDPSINASESLVIIYETDVDAILPHLPTELELISNQAVFQIAEVEGTGIGSYSRAQLHVQCKIRDDPTNKTFLYSLICIADCSSTITFGREKYGKPFKYGFPELRTDKDTLVCSVKYGEQEIVRGSMMFKHFTGPESASKAKKILSAPELNLKVIPHASGNLSTDVAKNEHSICQLVAVSNSTLEVTEVYEGHAALDFIPHVHAPFCDFPIHKITNAFHLKSQGTRSVASIVHDYLKQ